MILILQGPPAVGKTTYRKQLIEEDNTYRYVNADELREEFPALEEKDIQELQKQLVRDYLTNGYNVIIDNTNLNPRTVEVWKNLARAFKTESKIIQFFDISFEEALARDRYRPQSVGKSVLWKMYIDAGLNPENSLQKYPAVIFDIDGTLAIIKHRLHFIQKSPKDWNGFFSKIPEDIPNRAVITLLRMVTVPIILVSGRNEKYRAVTEKWLHDHEIEYDFLFMREFNDRRDDAIIKKEIYIKYIEPYFDIDFIVDDRNRVVEMWRSLGLTCLQVADGDF